MCGSPSGLSRRICESCSSTSSSPCGHEARFKVICLSLFSTRGRSSRRDDVAASQYSAAACDPQTLHPQYGPARLPALARRARIAALRAARKGVAFARQALYSSVTLPASTDMQYSSKILLFCLCVVFQTGCSSQAVYTAENFSIDSPFKVKVDAEVATACESARRALLGQGYLIESGNSDGIKARKAYKSADDQNTFIEMTIVCLPERNGSTLFATGVLSAYALKKSTSSASVGLSALGSISLPIGQSADSLVKVSEETINDKEFYRRFFAVVDNTLEEMRAGKAAPPEPVPVAPEPGPAEAAPATVGGPEPAAVAAPAAPVTPEPATVPAPAAPVTAAEPVPQPVAPAPEPVPASVAPIITVPALQTAPAPAAEPIPEQAVPATVPPAPVPEQAAPASPEPLLRQRQGVPPVTPEQPPVVAPAEAPAMEPAPVQPTPAIVAEPDLAPVQQAPERAVLEELQPITVQKTRWPVIAPVIVLEPEPAEVQEAPPPAPEKLPPIDPFR